MLKIEDLKEGEIYYRDYFIFIHVKIDPYKCNNTAISIRNNRFYNANAAIDNYNKNPDRLATPEEKHWLNECIKVNKFITYEEAIKTFKKENKSLIGRYLKYIGKSENLSKYGDYFKIITDKRGANLLRLSDNVPNCIWFGTEELLSNPKNDYWELMPEEWVPEKENILQFEVGKWYVNKEYNFYAKCLKFERNKMFCNEHILRKSYFTILNYSFVSEYNWELLTDLSEIQPYLPDEHPDKIKWASKIEDKFGHKPDFINKQETNNSIPEYVECISNNDIIEVGDKVEIIKDGRGNCSSNSIGYRFIVKEIYKGENIYLREFKEKPTGVDISYCKLIKKASQTTTYEKQVDNVSPQVNTDLILIKKAKKAKGIDILPIQSPIFVNQKVNNKKQLLILN